MRSSLICCALISLLCQAPAYSYSPEPLSFKAKFLLKTTVLWAPRTIKFLVKDKLSLKESLYFGVFSEVHNLRCQGQGWEGFRFWSWGSY